MKPHSVNASVATMRQAALWVAALLLLAPAWGAAAAPPTESGAAAAPDFSFSDPYFEMVGDSESIPFGVVTAQALDAKGLFWIGTQNGLVSYDGYRFNKFTHTEDDPGSLGGDYINCIEADPDGRLWVGTVDAGLSVYNPRSSRFTAFHHDAAQPDSLSGDEVNAIVADDIGGHWIGTDKGLDYQARNGRGFLHYRHDPAQAGSVADNYVRSLLIDRRRVLWIGSNNGLQRLRPGGRSPESVASDQGDPESLGGREIRSLFQAADGKIWVGTGNHGVAWLEPESLKLHWPSIDPAHADRSGQASIKTIAQPQADEIWLARFGGGIDIVSAVDGRLLRRLRHDPSNVASLALDVMGSLMFDGSGQLWIGTWGGGLQRYLAANQAFHLLRHSPNRPSGLSDPDVHSALAQDDGRILVGTSHRGIDIIDRQHGLVGGYRPHPGDPGGLPDDIMMAMKMTADGTLWVATQQSGVLRLAPGSNRWQAYAIGPNRVSPAVNNLLVSRSGELYAGTDEGLWHWREEQKRFETYAAADGSPMQVPIYPLAEDRQGRIWIGSLRGLWVLEPGAKLLQSILTDPKRPASINSNMMSGLLFDREDRLWVAAESGLDRLRNWDGKQAEFDHISKMAGHASQNFGANLLEDKSGRIWSEDHVFDPARMQIIALTKADGMDIGTPWTGSYARTADGLLLFGGTQGLAVVDPEKFRPWENQPALIATELKINGISQPLGALEPTLTLAPAQRNFSIEFSALDYSAPQKNQYSYRLLGYDPQWITTDAAHRSANYGNLWPGQYTLQVRGSNRLGVWSAHLLSIPITVSPAFWQTAWFLALALVLAVSAVYGGYRWRVAVLQAKAKALQALVDIRTHELLEKNRELERLAVTDTLTRLYNRLKLDEQLEAQFVKAERYDTSFALVLADFDQFKSINDTYGHQVGDQVLVACAGILAEHTRDADIVGRWGGEEFLIIASNTDLAGAMEMAEKLRKKMAEHPFRTVGYQTASFGVTAFRTGDSIADMLLRTDNALYRAKNNGRNRVECNP